MITIMRRELIEGGADPTLLRYCRLSYLTFNIFLNSDTYTLPSNTARSTTQKSELRRMDRVTRILISTQAT